MFMQFISESKQHPVTKDPVDFEEFQQVHGIFKSEILIWIYLGV